MEQRLRLVPENHPVVRDSRATTRHRISVPGEIVWKDASGTTRIVPVRTRDVSDHGVSVECMGGLPIPLFRLVHFEVDRQERARPDLPPALRKSSVLCAVFRVGPCGRATGAPGEYALRLLLEPGRAVAARTMSVSSRVRSA